jgi:23S rRNA maturation-related 3'-5' exoribonuclease YhaM
MNAPQKPLDELLSDKQQASLIQLAKDAGLSKEEFLLRASLSLLSERNLQSLSDLLDLAVRRMNHACASIDETAAFVDASLQRMAAREASVQERR